MKNNIQNEVNELMASFGMCGNPSLIELENARRLYGDAFIRPLNNIYNAAYSNVDYNQLFTAAESAQVIQQQSTKGNFWDGLNKFLGATDTAVNIYNKAKGNDYAINQSPDAQGSYIAQPVVTQKSSILSGTTLILIVALVVVLGGLFLVFKK